MIACAPPSIWQLIDAVLVINLDHRADRWTQFQQAAAGIIPPDKILRIPAVDGKEITGFGARPWFRGRKRDRTWAARAGCVLSHRRALATTRDHGWQTVLILEDDVAIEPAFGQLAEALAATLAGHPEAWQICYLGFTEPLAPCRVIAAVDDSHQLCEISGCTTTHAYLVQSRASGWILANLPDASSIWPWLSRHRAIDRWYQTVLARHFPVACVSPAVMNQRQGFSDIVQRQTDELGAGGQPLRAPDPATSPFVFSCCRRMRFAVSHIGQISDVLRGFAKRLRGF